MSDIFDEDDIVQIKKIYKSTMRDIANIAENQNSMDDKEFISEVVRLEKITNLASRHIRSAVQLSKMQYKKTPPPVDENNDFTEHQLQVMARALSSHAGLIILPPQNPTEKQKIVYSAVKFKDNFHKIDMQELCRQIQQKHEYTNITLENIKNPENAKHDLFDGVEPEQKALVVAEVVESIRSLAHIKKYLPYDEFYSENSEKLKNFSNKNYLAEEFENLEYQENQAPPDSDSG